MGATRSAPNIVSQRGPRRNIPPQIRTTPPGSAPRVPRRSTIPPSKKPERMAGSFSPRPPRRPVVHKDIRPEFGRRKQAKEERDKRMEEERREQNIARTDI